jgi:beta-N-acetylhexosaminidase
VATDQQLRRLILRTLLPAFPGHTAPEWATRLTAEGIGGWVIFGYNIASAEQLTALTGQLRAAHPDVLLGIDEEGGDVTRLAHTVGSPYPGNAALGAVNDIAVTEQIYRCIGLELAAAGINLNLAPTLDVNVEDDNPVIGTRSFGAGTALVSAHAAAAVTGLESVGVAACAKHFPGHGATATDSHLELPTVDVPVDVLWERELPPFAAAIKAGIKSIMTAHIRVPALTGDLPATFSSAVLVDLLRNQLGFTGCVVTDALEMRGAAALTGGVPGAAVAALAAGADLLCLGAQIDEELVEATVAAITTAVAEGRLPVARLEQAAARVDTLAAAARPAYGAAALAVTGPGYDAALRAIRVEGTLPDDLTGALIVQVESESSIAAGPVPWGLGAHTSLPVLRVPSTVDAGSVPGVGDPTRPVVVVGRNLHRLPGAPALIETLAANRPVVVVEMGWPSAWRPTGVTAFLVTYGASHANGAAAARTLALPTE